ncbi:MAG: hypothetical protein ACR2JJ_00100 [Sphingomicrobium sp.]
MRKMLFALPVALGAATPAHATGGMVCRTAGASPIEVSVGFGHVSGAPLISSATRLLDNGRNVPVTAPQWWLDNSELRLLLADPNAMRREVIIKAKRNGHVYDGSLWRHGKRRWVRCREG